MPDESCRFCGGALKECTQCASCKKPVSMICCNCGKRTAEQFHNYCLYHVDHIQTNQVPTNRDGGCFQVVIGA